MECAGCSVSVGFDWGGEPRGFLVLDEGGAILLSEFEIAQKALNAILSTPSCPFPFMTFGDGSEEGVLRKRGVFIHDLVNHELHRGDVCVLESPDMDLAPPPEVMEVS